MKKVKVLHVFKNMERGGAETLIMNIFRIIDRNKIQFDFLLTSEKEGSYCEEIRKLGGTIYKLDKFSNKKPIKNMKNIIKTIKQNGGYDVIHIPMMFYSGWVCLSAWIAGVPNRIVHSHNADEIHNNSILRKLYITFSRILINMFSTCKIACGERARDFLFGNSKKVKEQTIILKNGIDISKFQNVSENKILKTKKQLGIKIDEMIVGEVARFSEQKNHRFYIDFARYLKNNKLMVKIILVGDGKLRKSIEKKVKDNQLEEYFIFTGIREDIPELLNIFDVFCMPSLYEGFPVSIVESLAAGTPCVVSENISKETNLIDGMVKYISIQEEPKKWYEEIKKISNKNFNKSNIKSILEEKGYSIEKTTEKLQKIYLKGK